MKKKTAINLAIQALIEKRKQFAPGYNVYKRYGHSGWAKKDFDKYIKLSNAIEILKGIN